MIDNLIKGASNLALCISKSDDPYTEKEYLQDIYDYVWKSTRKGLALKDREKEAQITFVNSLIQQSGINATDKAKKSGVGINGIQQNPTLDQWLDQKMFQYYGQLPQQVIIEENPTIPVQGMGFQRKVKATFPSIAPIYYDFLLKTKTQLEQTQNTNDLKTQNHYAYLLHVIKKAMKNN